MTTTVGSGGPTGIRSCPSMGKSVYATMALVPLRGMPVANTTGSPATGTPPGSVEKIYATLLLTNAPSTIGPRGGPIIPLLPVDDTHSSS